MYLRNFTEALNIYDHLSLSSNEQDSIADECIAYNLDIYQKEGKIQCLFVAGYLQYRIKDNLPMALEYLEEYSIAAKNQKGHSCLTKRAYKYLSQIRKSLEQIS